VSLTFPFPFPFPFDDGEDRLANALVIAGAIAPAMTRAFQSADGVTRISPPSRPAGVADTATHSRRMVFAGLTRCLKPQASWMMGHDHGNFNPGGNKLPDFGRKFPLKSEFP
jgi:hypothetical protein